jgi:hypothetical protein
MAWPPGACEAAIGAGVDLRAGGQDVPAGHDRQGAAGEALQAGEQIVGAARQQRLKKCGRQIVARAEPLTCRRHGAPDLVHTDAGARGDAQPVARSQLERTGAVTGAADLDRLPAGAGAQHRCAGRDHTAARIVHAAAPGDPRDESGRRRAERAARTCL